MLHKLPSAKVSFLFVLAVTFLAGCGGGGSSSSSSQPVSMPELSLSMQLLDESITVNPVAVSLSSVPESNVSVSYRLLAGTAEASVDYVDVSGVLTFASGVQQAVLNLNIINDVIEEPEESFTLEFFQEDGIKILTPNVEIRIAANDSFTWTALTEFHPNWGVEGVFADAASCGTCHSAASDASGVLRFPQQADGEDISPYAGWRHTVMAHSFNDPYYQAVVQDEVKHFPSLAGTIEDKCLTCHTPMAHNHAHRTGVALDTDTCLSTDGCYRMAEAESNMAAREGVSCTLCHQVDTSSPDSTFSGGFVVDSNALTIYGPYNNPVTNPMLNNTQYSVAGLAAIQNSLQCAVCHNLKTPSVNVDTGQFTGNEFVEQSPYSEWFNSQFNEGSSDDKQCQDCHMPRISSYESQIATLPNGNANLAWPIRDEYSQHLFLGGNNYLLTLLKNFREELGISNTTTVEGFNKQIDSNTQFLTGQAASVSISNIDLVSDTLQVDVDISNHSGHKLPTSFPSRRVWLNLVIKNSTGEILFESGTPNEDGYLTVDVDQAAEKCTADVKTASYIESECFSKHKNIITSADEIAIYETVMGDTNNQVTYILLHADSYLKDNRIPPAGFAQSGVRFSNDVAVIGDALADPDFNRDSAGDEGTGMDSIHYQLDWSAKPANISVEATLYYQTIKPAFVTGLHNHGDKIDRFKWMYSQHKPQPVSLASDQQSF